MMSQYFEFITRGVREESLEGTCNSTVQRLPFLGRKASVQELTQVAVFNAIGGASRRTLDSNDLSLKKHRQMCMNTVWVAGADLGKKMGRDCAVKYRKEVKEAAEVTRDF